MTMPKCEKTWMVEAMRDGRIVGDERERAQRHVESCTACAAEQSALDRLASILRDGSSVSTSSEAVDARDRVMARVDAEVSGRAARSEPRRLARASAIGALVLACVAVVLFLRRSRAPVEVAHVESFGTGARFVHTTASNVESVRVDEGHVRIRVRRDGDARRVVVLVPDAEIEDIGTVFEVDVSSGHLQSLRVSEGAVILRRPSSTPVSIARGETWQRAEPAGATVSPSPPAPVTSAPEIALSALPAAPAPSARSRPVPSVTTSAAPQGSTADEGAAEDAAYLEVFRLSRAGRSEEARAAANDYLRRFPNGFRRDEVRKLAR